jgi:hypothetical protein
MDGGRDRVRESRILYPSLEPRAVGNNSRIQSELEQPVWSSEDRSSFMLTIPSRTVECGDDQMHTVLAILEPLGLKDRFHLK